MQTINIITKKMELLSQTESRIAEYLKTHEKMLTKGILSKAKVIGYPVHALDMEIYKGLLKEKGLSCYSSRGYVMIHING